MIWGSETPYILYCSEEKIIIDGTFGVVIYDLENGRLTDRISYDKIRELGMGAYGNYASEDGKTLYFTDMEAGVGAINSYVAYDIESGKASPAKEVSEEEFPGGFTRRDGLFHENFDPEGYEKYYEKYIAENCLIGDNSVPLENEFVFLTVPSFMLYDTQIVVCDYNGGERVYRVFDNID